MGLKSVLFSGILLSVMAVGVQAKPETGRGLDKSLLPQPVYSPEPGLVDLYWAAWDLAWWRVKHQNGIPQSPYMDENLWDDTIWIWDTEFMVLFCRYAPSLFPGIQSLDNFYKTILDGEPVSLKIWHPDNPPFFAWVEYEYYKMTGDKRRLEYVLEDNRYLQRHFYWFEKLKRGGSRFSKMPVMLERREKGYLWGDVQSGMDNTPRGRGCNGEMLWMDALAQQALAALYIERIAEVLDDSSTAKEFAGEYAVKKDLLNKYYWDAEDGFYYDIEEATGDFVKVRTPAVYWAMLAEVPGRKQAARLVEYAQDEDEFGGQYPWPSVSRSDADYNGTVGDYWRGGVWLPLAYMSTKALETYGYHDVAHENARRLLAQMSETYKTFEPHSIWECYSPSAARPGQRVDGENLTLVAQDFCGWSALGPISLFIENVLGFYNIDATARLVEWRKTGWGEQGIRNLRFGDVHTDIVADGDTVRVVSDKEYVLKVNGKKYKVKAGTQAFTLK